VHALIRANEWDKLFTVIKNAGGNIISCTSGVNVVNCIPGLTEYLLMIAKEEARQEYCSMMQKDKMDRYVPIFQLDMKE
jgi:hypothetical protein